MPEPKQIIFEGKHKRLIKLSDEERLQNAKESLLTDNSGYFDEFVHDTKLRSDVTEVIRALFTEFYKHWDIPFSNPQAVNSKLTPKKENK